MLLTKGAGYDKIYKKFYGARKLKLRIKSAIAMLTAAATLTALLSSCQGGGVTKKTKTGYGMFDSYATVMDYSGGSDERFSELAADALALLSEYHRLFDIYNEYDGIVNLATVNRTAAEAPVKVDGKIIELLIFSKEIYELTDGATDVTMGAVLRLWHECREEAEEEPEAARLPDGDELKEAATHVGFDKLVIDTEAKTVYFSDPKMSLDVGAVAKGYATEMAARMLEERGAYGYVLDVGGNLRVIGTKPDGSGWQSGVRNPDVYAEEAYVYYFELSDGAAVTSGDYERYYTVDGKRYHHIISKDTLMPSEYFSSVTVICGDSGLADGLSTALFNMNIEAGRALVGSLDGVRAVWVTKDGEVLVSE